MLTASTIIMAFPDGTSGKESESRSVVSKCLWPHGLYHTVHGVLQARIPEWVGFPFSRGSSQPRDQTLLPRCRWICYLLSAPACQCRRHKRHGFSPWVGKIHCRSTWQPTWAFLLENPMERGAWRATVCGITKSCTQLRRLTQTHTHCYNSKLSLIMYSAILCISC